MLASFPSLEVPEQMIVRFLVLLAYLQLKTKLSPQFLLTRPGVNINSCHFIPPSGGLLSRCLLEIPHPCLVLCLLHRIIHFSANPTSPVQVGRYSMNPSVGRCGPQTGGSQCPPPLISRGGTSKIVIFFKLSQN